MSLIYKLENKSLFMLILFIVSFLIYVPALKAPFFWDDYISIPEIQPYRGIEHTESRPLRMFSFYYDKILWGKNPAGYHFTNVFLNSVVVVLVFMFLNIITENNISSFIISMLFAFHPLHTETVIWIKNRTEILFLLFFMLSFIFYHKKKIWLSVISFVFCALSKETSVIFPVFLTVYIYMYLKDRNYKITVPFYIIAVARGIYSLLYAEKIVGQGDTGGFFNHINLVLNTFGFYLSKLLLPYKLLVDWQISVNFSLIYFLLFAGLISVLFIKNLDKNIKFFIGLTFISILPYSNIIFIAGRPIGEQRMYLAVLGFAGLVYYAVEKFVTNRKVFNSVLSLLILLYGTRTYTRALEWQNPVLLWQQAEKNFPNSARIKYNLGSIYYDKGDYENAKKYFYEALKNSDDEESQVLTLNSLALIHMKENDLVNASKILERLINVKTNPAVMYNLGLVYIKMKEYKKAADILEKTRKLIPQAKEVYNNLAVCYMNLNMPDKAAEVLKDIIRIYPDYRNGIYNLIVIYKKSGRKQEALKETEMALKIFGNDPVFIKLYQELKV